MKLLVALIILSVAAMSCGQEGEPNSRSVTKRVNDQRANGQRVTGQRVNDPRVPPFHESAEAAMPFPKTLSPSWIGAPVARRAYVIAQQIPGVLAQQPCYCWCDRYGHGSLLDCHKDRHSAT